MKRLFLSILICSFFSLYGNRAPNRLIILFDWFAERISKSLEKANLDPKETGWGPITTNLVTGLQEKAAPIIVTSSVWQNFVARRKLFKDFLEGNGSIYKNYPRFKDEAKINQFKQYIEAYFQPHGQQVLVKLSQPIRRELDMYYLCYVTSFEEDEWILKKVSDYIYIIVPKIYLEQLKSKPLPATERDFAKPLSEDDLYLGLKIDTMATMSYQDALNPDKHKLSIDKSDYLGLVRKKDVQIVKRFLTGSDPEEYKATILETVTLMVISRHFIKVLTDMFVTVGDMVDKDKNPEKTELNRALYMQKWHIYLEGHGRISEPETLLEERIRIQAANYAGMEQLAFREWLYFLQRNILTEFLFYKTCFSGGHHLQKLYEHQWDYPLGKEVKQDIFTYMIATANLAYTTTWEAEPAIYPLFSKIAKPTVEYRIDFESFFKASEKYFSIGQIEIAQKKTYFDILKKLKEEEAKKRSMMGRAVLASDSEQVTQAIENLKRNLKKLDFITLNDVLMYVCTITKENQPAVRYPGTEWFVPIPLDEAQQLADRIRFERSEQTQERKKEEDRVKEMIQKQTEKHIQKQKEQQPQEAAQLAQKEQERQERERQIQLERQRVEQERLAREGQSVPVSNAVDIIKTLHNFQQGLLQIKQKL